MLVLVLLHAVVAAVVLSATRLRGTVAAALGIAVFAATAVTAALQGIGSDVPATQSWDWVPDLGLQLTTRLDGFAVVMVLLVSVIGAIVLAAVGVFSISSS